MTGQPLILARDGVSVRTIASKLDQDRVADDWLSSAATARKRASCWAFAGC